MDSPQAVISAIEQLRAESPRLVVGVSGYAGSGKSTLTRALVSRIDGSARIRGDDFLDPERSHHRSRDWDGVDRVRLLRQRDFDETFKPREAADIIFPSN
jgi:uridine kinase